MTSTFVSRGRRGTWRHLPPFQVAGVVLGDTSAFVCLAGVALREISS